MGEDRSLRASPLFRGLPDDEMALIARALRPTAFARGDTIVRQGDRSDAAYVIASGQAAVVARDLTGQEVTLRVFGPSDTFGEVGLVTGEPRTATVRAQTEVAAYMLTINAFERIRALCPRLVERLESYADLLEMDRFLQLASPFRGMPKERIRDIASRMQPLVVAAGAIVVRQGEVGGDLFYFVRSGSFEVLKDGKRVHVLGAGDVFGEIALLTGGPRIATVRATSNAELYTLSKADFDAAVRESEITRGALQELTRIRYRATVGQPIVLPDPVSTLMPFLPAQKRGRYWKLLLAGTLLFAVSTIAAITFAIPFALYLGLVAGSLVIPIVYVAYLSETGIVSDRPLTLGVTFVLGALLGLPIAYLAERQLGLTGGSLGGGLIIGAIEEVAKLLGVVWLLRRTTARFQMDGVIFGAAAGMGFAAFETMLFGLERIEQAGAVLAMLWIRAALAPLGHGTWTAIVSGMVWRQKTARGIRIDVPVLLSLALVIALHGLWDWQPLDGLWNIAWSALIGLASILLLRTVVQRATAEELSAVVALNPDLAQASPDAPRLACRVCEQISPPGAHYCVRCGAALVGTDVRAVAPREPGRLERAVASRAASVVSVALTVVLAVGAAASAITTSGGAGVALLLSVGADADLVKNGDFTHKLEGWTAFAPKPLKAFGFPTFDPDSAFGKPAAAIEVALGADGYLEQQIDLPSGYEYTLAVSVARLTFSEVTAYVVVVDQSGKANELDRFVPGCTAQASGSGEPRTYDLTPYAGQKIKLRLGAQSGAISFDRRAFFTNVAIHATLPGLSKWNASSADDKADCPIRAYALTPGAETMITHAAGDVEFFRLDTKPGYQYTVKIQLGSLEAARLSVYRSDLALFAVQETEDRSAKALVVSTDGATYYVGVRGLLLKYGGDYSISVVESTIDGPSKP